MYIFERYFINYYVININGIVHFKVTNPVVLGYTYIISLNYIVIVWHKNTITAI